jgi:hypothetical protein
MSDTILGNVNSTQTLLIGLSGTSAIDYFGDTDWWKVDLSFGYTYQVWIEGYFQSKGTLYDPYLAIYNGNGSFAFSNDDAYYLSFYSYATVTPNSTGYLVGLAKFI